MRADSPLVDSVLEAANYTDRSVQKCYITLHSIESPLGKSWAEALAGPAYFQNPNTKASVHYVVDADTIVQTAPEDRWTWSTGSPGSRPGVHIEQAGYAAFTQDQWLGNAAAVGTTYVRPNGAQVTYTAQDAADARTQFQLVAGLVADICTRRGWDPVAAVRGDLLREVAGENLGRHVRHMDITEWVGGTTHTDPGTGYPWNQLLARANELMHPTAPTPTQPTAPTTPSEDTVSLKDYLTASDKRWYTLMRDRGLAIIDKRFAQLVQKVVLPLIDARIAANNRDRIPGIADQRIDDKAGR